MDQPAEAHGPISPVASAIELIAPAHGATLLLAAYLLVAVWYCHGLYQRRARGDIVSAAVFITGLACWYLFTQSGLDTLGRRLFLAHRAQHLVLHHLGPFLIALAAPSAVLAAGLPTRWRERLRAWQPPRAVIALYRAIQQPLVGGLLFVGLIALWLTPAVHHWAMAGTAGYWLMNGSMMIEGLAFWWFMLDRRPPGASPTTHGMGTRIVVLWAVMPPQIAIGAYITLAPVGLYPGYGPAEAAYGITAGVDQQVGGLLTWIPPAMMSLIGTLVILRFGFVHARSRSEAEHVAADPAGNPTS